jgi:hypothetical protein
MRDARYWRAQAQLCLDIARQMSDSRTADDLRATAADFFARATEFESQTDPSPPSSFGGHAGSGGAGN